MRITTCVLSCALAAGLTQVAGAQVFGVGNFGTFTTQSLYTINPTTGAATAIGNTGLSQIADLAYDASTDRLIALTVDSDWYELSRTTGAATLLVDDTSFLTEGALAFNSAGLAFTTIFDTLHAWNGTTWLQSGASGLTTTTDISGLTFGAGGTLLGLASNGAGADELVSFNVNTGAASVIGATGTGSSSLSGLAFTGSEVLATNGSELFRIDQFTGATTFLGAHGVAGMSGIAFIPSPAATGLLAVAGLLAARRRR